MDFKAGTVGTIYKNYFRPEHDAIHFKEKTWSYAELDDNVRAFANYLKDKGVSKDDKVILNAAPMPDKYIKEMYCDMVGAAKAYGGGSAKEYYLKMQREWVLHPETKVKFEKMLGIV